MIPVEMQQFLDRKYALLQQNADAATKNAETGAMTGAAAAGLDKVRAALLPAESAAGIAKSGAETNLFNQQASVVVPESKANIAKIGAETRMIDTSRKYLIQDHDPLIPRFGGAGAYNESLAALRSTLGSGGYQGYRLPSDPLLGR